MHSSEFEGINIKRAEEWIQAATAQNPVPPVLFRFFSDNFFERVWDVVACNRLYMSSPDTFNDPLDCAVEASLGTDDEVLLAWQEILSRQSVPVEAAGTLEEFKARTLSEMRRRDRFRVACFGADPKQSLMWSHYANGHRGLALAFDYSVLADAGIVPTPVMYSVERMKLRFPTNGLDELYLALFHKAEEWKYEAEFRLCQRAEDGEWINLPARALCGVYLGMRVPSLFAERVLLLLESHKSVYVRRDLPVFQARPLVGNYGLSFQQIR